MAIRKTIHLPEGTPLQRLRESVEASLSTIKVDGEGRLVKDHELFLCDFKAPRLRSKDYNAYYWGVVLKQIAAHTGHEPEELHDWYKTKFAITFVTAFGETVETVKETSRMKTPEFQRYVNLVRLHGLEIGAGYIPEPNELTNETLAELLSRERGEG